MWDWKDEAQGVMSEPMTIAEEPSLVSGKPSESGNLHPHLEGPML